MGQNSIFATFYCYLHKYLDTIPFLSNNTVADQENDADCVIVLNNENMIRFMIIYLLSCLKFTFCLAGESLLNGLLLLVFDVRASELLRASDSRQALSGVCSVGLEKWLKYYRLP